jgi:hypothetical protein
MINNNKEEKKKRKQLIHTRNKWSESKFESNDTQWRRGIRETPTTRCDAAKEANQERQQAAWALEIAKQINEEESSRWKKRNKKEPVNQRHSKSMINNKNEKKNNNNNN